MVQAPDLTIAPVEGNVPEAVEATSPEEGVEPVAAEEAESAPEAAVETETEPAPLPEPTDEQVRGSRAFKDALARESQSIKDRSEASAQKSLEQRQRQWLASGEYVQALSQTIDPDTGTIEVPKAQRLVNALQTAADVEATATVIEVLRALMPEDAKLTVADQNRVDRARSLEDKLKVNYELAVNAGVAAREAEIRKSAMADARKELAAAVKTADLKKADETRRGEPQPTTSSVPSNGAASGWTTQLQIHTAIANAPNAQERRQLAEILNTVGQSLPYQ